MRHLLRQAAALLYEATYFPVDPSKIAAQSRSIRLDIEDAIGALAFAPFAMDEVTYESRLARLRAAEAQCLAATIISLPASRRADRPLDIEGGLWASWFAACRASIEHFRRAVVLLGGDPDHDPDDTPPFNGRVRRTLEIMWHAERHTRDGLSRAIDDGMLHDPGNGNETMTTPAEIRLNDAFLATLPGLIRVCRRRYGLAPDDAHDIVMDAYVRVVQRVRRPDCAIDNFRAYLHRVVAFALATHWRDRERERRRQVPLAGEVRSRDEFAHGPFPDWLDALSGTDRELVESIWHGRSIREFALRSTMSLPTAYRRRAALARRLACLLDGRRSGRLTDVPGFAAASEGND